MQTLLATLALAAPAEEPVESEQPYQRVGWGFGGVPAVNYNSDDGFGFGIVGSVYRYDGQTSPYRTGVTLIVFATTKAVQDHSLRLDLLRVGGLPLRINSRLTFRAYRSDNFCGYGNAVTCSVDEAEERLTELGVTGPEREEQLSTYYKTRYINPNIDVIARWQLDPMPHRLEVFGGLRALTLRPGDFKVDEPYPNSLYAQTFPDGERGFLGVASLGVMLDNRDNEPAPTRGYWLEGSIRGSSKVWGSDWSYFGVDLTSRTYVPLGTDRVVWANRVILDGQFTSSLPILELAFLGVSQRHFAYGNLNVGRGIRQRRFIGEAVAVEQAEVRWTALKPTIAGVPIDIGLLGFVDVGFVGEDTRDALRMFRTPLVGTGGGLRLALEKNFVIRADVGVSPLEDYAPKVYIDLNNTF